MSRDHTPAESKSTGSRRVPDAPHGTLRGYSMGCRCVFCRSAKDATTVSDDGTREGHSR